MRYSQMNEALILHLDHCYSVRGHFSENSAALSSNPAERERFGSPRQREDRAIAERPSLILSSRPPWLTTTARRTDGCKSGPNICYANSFLAPFISTAGCGVRDTRLLDRIRRSSEKTALMASKETALMEKDT